LPSARTLGAAVGTAAPVAAGVGTVWLVGTVGTAVPEGLGGLVGVTIGAAAGALVASISGGGVGPVWSPGGAAHTVNSISFAVASNAIPHATATRSSFLCAIDLNIYPFNRGVEYQDWL